MKSIKWTKGTARDYLEDLKIISAELPPSIGP
jgi:hypothetical protein